jgi:arginine decarboxylase
VSHRHFPFEPGSAPFWDAYVRSMETVKHSFAIPGHKRRADVLGGVAAWDRPISLSSRTDIPSLSLLRNAESAAAALWGADHCRFSVNGSSAANQAAVSAVAGPGDRVIASRAIHKSLLFGFIQAGVSPIWLPSSVEPDGSPSPVKASDVERLLGESEQVKAVFLGSPTYVGIFSDIAEIAAVCHSESVPLVVDAAWGGHFGFHPHLPPNPLAAGADIVVLSAHKTLPALTQGAMIFLRGGRVSRARFDRVFDSTQTTSPSAATIASMDAARAFLSQHGEEAIGDSLAAVASARADLNSIQTLEVPAGPNLDPMKLIIRGRGGFDGVALEAALSRLGFEVEAADRSIIIPQITLVDSQKDIEALARAIVISLRECRGGDSAISAPPIWSVTPVQRISPRRAFYAQLETVPREAAVGRISGELISPYPPGIPVLAPGEEITVDALDALDAAARAGIRIAYASDESLNTLVVVADEPSGEASQLATA